LLDQVGGQHQQKVFFFFPNSRDLSERKMKWEERERIGMKDLVISRKMEYKFFYCQQQNEKRKKSLTGLVAF
jgi:hypothetical protein